MNWTTTLVAGWAALIATSTFQAAMPASWYFEPGDLHVYDAGRGDCPALDYPRDIHRPFHAEWVVTVDRQGPQGRFWVFEVASGEGDYSPDATVPPEPDLCWWMWRDRLDLPPGHYRIRTLWRLDVPGGFKEIRRGSNVFAVSP